MTIGGCNIFTGAYAEWGADIRLHANISSEILPVYFIEGDYAKN